MAAKIPSSKRSVNREIDIGESIQIHVCDFADSLQNEERVRKDTTLNWERIIPADYPLGIRLIEVQFRVSRWQSQREGDLSTNDIKNKYLPQLEKAARRLEDVLHEMGERTHALLHEAGIFQKDDGSHDVNGSRKLEAEVSDLRDACETAMGELKGTNTKQIRKETETEAVRLLMGLYKDATGRRPGLSKETVEGDSPVGPLMDFLTSSLKAIGVHGMTPDSIAHRIRELKAVF